MLIEVQAKDAGKRLDAFLHEQLPQFSRSRLQSWIKSGLVRVNGSELRASYLLRGLEAISVTPGELPPLKAEAEDLPLHILYEDDDVVAIDKPAGMVVHAGAGHTKGTLVNALLHHFGTLSSINGELRPGIVHRLDRDTSGVLVAARTDAAHQALAHQFQTRQVEKIYLALVHGRPRPEQGRITSPISRDSVRRTRMSTRSGTGRSALTDYRVIEDLGGFSLLEVRIGTGRTHQIRVHLASIGHPVFGDRLYGAPEAKELQRFFLHARRLRFLSPKTGEPITIESPLSPELSNFLDSLRLGTKPVE
ncbi:MAG TPA: RluA family pseudouridine synthase [Bryobacteraceae bacterium]|nr:RluA family pseudouridine synthase [Bryobacteraceae bacterium]